jgi:hypothetical protein
VSSLITLADARTFLKPFVDNGSCSTPLIDSRIAEIEERLWPKADWRMSHRRLRVLARNRVISLPHNVLKVCAVNIDGTPAAMMTDAYEFSSSGPGDLDYADAATNNLVDQGEFPTQFDIPVYRETDTAWSTGLNLIAFSKEKDDMIQTLTVRGFGPLNDEVRTLQEGALAPGEVIPINRWPHGIEGSVINLSAMPRSTSTYMSVSRVYKPATKGAIVLYAHNPTTGELFLLSKMEPDILIPSYRRYRITGMAVPETLSDGTVNRDCASLLLLVKLGWERAVRATDILYIQSLTALKLMAMAITHENAGNTGKSKEFQADAILALLDQKRDQEQGVTVPVIWDVDVNVSLRSINHGIR